MKKYYLFLFVSLFTFSCSDTDVITEENGLSLRASSTNTLFVNVESSTDAAGNALIEGEIYSSETTTATIQFAYQGDVGSTYEFRTPSILILPRNGASIRTVTTTLRPGANKFSLYVAFSSAGESARARASLISIGNNKSLKGEGYIDLAIDGYSRLWDPGSSQPLNTICSKCGAINSAGASRCVACGK